MKEASDCEIGKEIVTRWESLDDVERKEFEALSRKEKEERKKFKKLLKASFYVFLHTTSKGEVRSRSEGAILPVTFILSRYEDTNSVMEKEGW